MKAMILAAGRGKRMRPLTDHTPKPLLQVGRRALIEYHLETLARSGFEEVIINIAHLSHKIRAKLDNGRAYGLSITYSDEGDEALETGGGIHNALPLLGNQTFLVINGDIWCDYKPKVRTLSGNDLAHVILVDNPPHHPAGDFAIRHNRLVLEDNTKLTFSGIGYYHPDLFIHCKPGKFPLAPLLREAAGRNRVSAEHYRGVWNDIGTAQRLKELDVRFTKQSV